MFDLFVQILSIVYLLGFASSVYVLLLLVADPIRHMYNTLSKQLLILLSSDIQEVHKGILLNCQAIYRKRIRGKTKCNPIRFYSCKWRFQSLHLPYYRHTLILDLDETLVYSCRFSDVPAMVSKLESVGITNLRQNKYVSFYVYKRPFLDLFLDRLSAFYDIVIFTAGEKPYADAVINAIDPRGRIRRRYYKDDCSVVDGRLVKKICTVTNDNTSSIIVDNNPECFRLDKNNAILISSWYGNERDKELLNLFPFLILLSMVENVQSVLYLDQ